MANKKLVLAIAALAICWAGCGKVDDPASTDGQTRTAPQPPAGLTWESVQGSQSYHTVRVLWPNGGEEFVVGDTMRILIGNDPTGGAVDCIVDISVDGGRNWQFVDPGNMEQIALLGTYELRFVIPATLPTLHVSSVSDSCLIRVSEYQFEDETNDRSDAFFSIDAL